MGMPVVTGTQLVSWLRTEMAQTYKRFVTAVDKRLSAFMELGIPSDKLIEYYGYYLAAPHVKRWRRGEHISSKGFGSVSFSVENYNWGGRIEWHENDRRYEQTKTLVDRARDLGRSAVLLHERVGFQFITGATDNNLLDAVPLAPDGAALFATTAGGLNRFEVASGNLLTGTGVASPGAIRTDFYIALEQFRLMKDGEGQPLHDPSMLDEGFVIVYGAANDQVFREAFEQRITQGASAGISNIILDAGIRYELWPTQRITDNDWFVLAKGVQRKPLFQQEAKSINEQWATMDNSDQVRSTKVEYYQVDMDYGYGIALPYGFIKINN